MADQFPPRWSPYSPGNFASPAPAGVVLPASLEELINIICIEQSQPPLGTIVRRKLSLLTEEEALRILNLIRQTKITRSFDGFVTYLVNNRSPSSASSRQESIFYSPSFPTTLASVAPPNPRDLDEVTSSMQDRLRLSPIPTARQPGGQTLSPCINNRQFNELQAPSHANNSTNNNRHASSPSTSIWKANGPCLVSATNVLKPDNAPSLVPSINAWKPNGQISSPVLQALNEIEFRKSFLILSYIGRNKLEEVTSEWEIKGLAGFQFQSMGEFENVIWDRFGSRYCENKDRVKHTDWESGRYYYNCYVYPDGGYSLKGPILNKTATLLQKVLGDENVLIVKFYDLDKSSKKIDSSASYAAFHKIAEEGIFVGLKRFRFFAFKDGGKEEKKNSSSGAVKSYYVNVNSFARFYENKASCLDMISMRDHRCIFMHVHNASSLSAYMPRLVLTHIVQNNYIRNLEVNLDDPEVYVEIINDMPCKDVDGFPVDKDGKIQIHTDGTGFISEELALRCPRNCYTGNSINDQLFERYLEILRLGTASTTQFKPDMLQPPLLIQFRMFHNGCAVKGTVLVNKKLQGKRIQIRPSMIKIERDPRLSRYPCVNSFEIVSTSNRPRKARLSQSLIALLNYGGVPKDFFIGILRNEIWDAQTIFSNKRAALKVAINNGETDNNYTVAKMIFSGIPLDEPYIQCQLPVLAKQELNSLKEGKLPIGDSFNIMGTADPTGSLNSDEVCIILETGQIEGDVLVYRHPGVHFGDVHILKATRIKGLEEFVGTSKYGIFFPTNGPRSLADQMAGGDFDGDMYFVSRHPMLLTTFKQSEPWIPTPIISQSTSVNRKPADFPAEKLEHELFQLFLTTRFQPCISAGQAANCWLSYMDQLIDGEQKVDKTELVDKMLKLVDIYYEALDAPKKGKKVTVPRDLIPNQYPHFKPRIGQNYHSKSVLGEIFDKADGLKMEAPAVQVRKLPSLDIEVPLSCIISWEDHYKSYRQEMQNALECKSELEMQNALEFKSELIQDAARSASNVIKKYKQILYEADEFEKSPRAWEDLRYDAVAIYHVVYGYAMEKNQASYCGFAWRIASPVLLKIFMKELDEKPIACLPSVLREVL